MPTADDDRGTGPAGEDPPPIWGDVTERQPEREVPQPAADAYAVPPPPPGGWPTPPTPPAPSPADAQWAPEGLDPSAPQGSVAPQGSQPSGAPVFINPERAAAGAATPQFVKRDGTPAGPRYAAPAQPGAPIFVPPGGGAPVGGGGPGGPVFVQASPQESPVDPSRPWPWWVGPIAFVTAIGVVVLLGTVFAVIGAAAGGGEDFLTDNTHWLGLVQDTLWIGVALVVPFWVVKHLRAEQLGLRTAPLGRSVGVFFAALVAFYVGAAIYSAVFNVAESDNTLLSDTGFGDSLLKDLVLALVFTVGAPVAEELLFRGLLFRTLRDGLTKAWGKNGGLAGGAIISGLVFGGVHLGGGQDAFLPVLMLFGVILALSYHWSGTLYVPIFLHAVNNAVATGANADPSADWIYVVIGAGPILAVGTAWLIGRGVGKVFPSERTDPAHPPAQEPARL